MKRIAAYHISIVKIGKRYTRAEMAMRLKHPSIAFLSPSCVMKVPMIRLPTNSAIAVTKQFRSRSP